MMIPVSVLLFWGPPCSIFDLPDVQLL